jgi:hypothetical protein
MKRLLTGILLAGLLIPLPSPGLAATPTDAYVRTADYYLMSGPTLDSALSTLSAFDLLVIPSEAQVYNASFFSEIRSRNPDIIILAYVPTVSWNNAYWSDPLHSDMKKGIRDDYWLRDATGARKSVWPNTNALNLNSGWVDFLSDYVKTDILSTGYWDGVFFDEVTDSIDWVGALDTDRNGVNDTASEANARWEAGYVKLFSSARSKLGAGAIIITNGSSKSSYAPYVNGRMFETFPSSGNSLSSWVGSARDYLSLEDKVGYTPTMVVNVNTENTGNRLDYRKMRFGIATTLLGDGYFSFDFGTQNHSQTWTYDEYDAYLGAPKGDPENLTSPLTTTLSQGVWGRDFEQGKVVVNATDTQQTVRLDGEYEKLHGTQDTSINDGSIVSRVTLGAQDGVILLRPIEEIKGATFVNGAFARIFNGDGSVKRTGFFAYDSSQKGGTRVIQFDTDLDGKDETVVADDTWVTIYDDDGSMHARFAPYTENYKLGINLALGDIESDGSVELVTGTENGGGPQIRIFNKDGNLIHPGFFAYDTAFRGGVNVAIGDLNGDGIKEIIAGAGVGGGPHVRVFNKDGNVINPGFFAYDPLFRGGVNVAVGDVDGDGIDDIVTGPGKGGGAHVRVYDRDGHMKSQFFAFDSTETGGVEVTAADLDGDGLAEVIGLSTDVFTLSFK